MRSVYRNPLALDLPRGPKSSVASPHPITTRSRHPRAEQLRELIEEHSADLDWVGPSHRTAWEAVQAALGRGKGSHARQSIDLFELAHAYGIRTKLNTIVTALSWEEDMSAVVRRVQPARWKIFQVLPVGGQNDGLVEPLLITSDQFRAFVERHAPLRAEGWARSRRTTTR